MILFDYPLCAFRPAAPDFHLSNGLSHCFYCHSVATFCFCRTLLYHHFCIFAFRTMVKSLLISNSLSLLYFQQVFFSVAAISNQTIAVIAVFIDWRRDTSVSPHSSRNRTSGFSQKLWIIPQALTFTDYQHRSDWFMTLSSSGLKWPLFPLVWIQPPSLGTQEDWIKMYCILAIFAPTLVIACTSCISDRFLSKQKGHFCPTLAIGSVWTDIYSSSLHLQMDYFVGTLRLICSYPFALWTTLLYFVSPSIPRMLCICSFTRFFQMALGFATIQNLLPFFWFLSHWQLYMPTPTGLQKITSP